MKLIIKITAFTFAGLLAIALGVGILQYVASERVEVIVLHTKDAQGVEIETRLWVVDHKGSPYLRVGSDGSGWFSRLTKNEHIQVERSGEIANYVAEIRPELADEINDLMQSKYTWGDTLIGYLVGSRENSIPIRLVKAEGP